MYILQKVSFQRLDLQTAQMSRPKLNITIGYFKFLHARFSMPALVRAVLFSFGIKCIKIGKLCQNNGEIRRHTVSIVTKKNLQDERHIKIRPTACGSHPT